MSFCWLKFFTPMFRILRRFGVFTLAKCYGSFTCNRFNTYFLRSLDSSLFSRKWVFFNTFHNNLFGLVYLMTIMFAFRLSVAKVNTNANKEEGELNCNRKIPWGEEKGDGSSQDWFQADWLREWQKYSKPDTRWRKAEQGNPRLLPLPN